MNQSLPSRRLSFEHLEDRLTPTSGTPWFDGASLTLSFVPDGTDVSGTPSNLAALLGSNLTPAQWKTEILRAYQSWAAHANLNVGLVADGGQAMGVSGAPQEDVRFGDIRIGARPMSAAGSEHATLAGAVGFDYNAKTWAGDLVFNSNFSFGIGHTSQQNDLFAVALHEAGHSFGVGDTDDRASVMWARYEGVLTELAAADVEAIQALYGVRVDDAYEGAAGNGTLATAYDLTANGNLVALSADITRLGDADYYVFTTPAAATGVTALTVSIQATKISLLTARVTVYDESGNAVAAAVTTDPLSNDLSVSVPNYRASARYVVKVEGAGSDVFSVGSYVLRLNYSPYNPWGSTSAVTRSHHTNIEWAANGERSSADTLAPVRSGAKANTFTVVGSISSPTDVDWYKITPSAATAFTGTLFVGTMTTTNGLLPTVGIYNAAGDQLPAVVTMNDGGAFEVQLANASTGTTYYLRVAAADPSGSRSTGIYTLGASLAPVGPTTFDPVKSDTMSSAENTKYSKMTVEGDRLTQFALTATGGSSSAATAVRMTVFDAAGRAVFTAVAVAGQTLSTGSVWLASGEYTVVFNAATRDGSAIGSMGVAIAARTLSDPIDPYIEDPIDPTLPPPPPPPPQEPIVIEDPISTPTMPILDPITSPFLGLF